MGHNIYFHKGWSDSEILEDPGIQAGTLLDETETYGWNFQ